MTRFTSLTAALLASTAIVGTAQADVTPQQVWDSYARIMAFGPDSNMVVGSQQMEGDTLVVRDIVITTESGEMGDASLKSEITYPLMRLRDNGDGTVTLTMPEAAFANITGDDGEGSDFSAKVTIDYSDMEDHVSGDPERMVHESHASSARVELVELKATDAKILEPVYVEIRDMKSTLTQGVTDDGLLVMAGDASAGETTGKGKLDLGEGEGVQFDVSIDAIDMVMDMAMPSDLDMESEEYPAGMKVMFEANARDIAMDLTAMTPEGPLDMSLKSDNESLKFDISEAGLSYEQMSHDVALNLLSSQLPFPVNLSAKEMGAGLLMPFGQSDQPQPTGFKLIMDTVEFDDEIWALFDPSEQLPRGPITARIDLGGMIIVKEDLTNAAGPGSDAPFAPVSGSIEELKIEGAGLSVNGSGSVEFDENATPSFNGMPEPVGAVKIEASGVNGFIDNLIAMGVVPEEQATMTRMMLGMFAKSTGDDSMESEIEFREGGQIFANGQRLK